jgi:hypothetical protein
MNHEFYQPFLDLEGNPVTKDKFKYPYSYDPYVIFKLSEIDKSSESVYDDRMRMWNGEKYRKLKDKYLGTSDNLSTYSIENLEKFLRDYFDNPNLRLSR